MPFIKIILTEVGSNPESLKIGDSQKGVVVLQGRVDEEIVVKVNIRRFKTAYLELFHCRFSYLHQSQSPMYNFSLVFLY